MPNDKPRTTVCGCLGGSTHATDDPAVRLCDMCGGTVPSDPQTTVLTREQRIEIAAKAYWDGLRRDPRFNIGPWDGPGDHREYHRAMIWPVVDALFPEDAKTHG